MRILQVCPGVYVSGRGGISEHVMRVSEALVKRGHDVTVFGTNSGGLPWFEVVNGVKVRRFRRFAPGGAYFFSPDMLFAMAGASFDVVHAHGLNTFPTNVAFLAKNRRFVVTPHFHGSGSSVFRDCLLRLFRYFAKKTMLRADVVVAVSEYEKQLLVEQFRFDKRKVVVVPNGLDFEEFKGIERHERGFRSILFVGRLERYKGVQYLVEVLPLLPEDVILEIVGRGSLRAELESRAKKLGVSDRVLFFQDLSRRELLQKYFDSDVLVLLSKYEAYGLVVAEALIAGTSCIVADTSALSEWIDGVNCFGITVPVKFDTLAELIKRSFDGRMVQRTSGNIDKILSWKTVAWRLEDIYYGNRLGD